MTITWQASDLAALDRAIAAGAEKVRFSDGREVTYRSLADMRSIRSEIASALGAASGRPRATFASYRRD